MSIPNINKTRISVVTKPTNVSVVSVGIQGKPGATQDLSAYATTGSNNFIGNQFISGSIQVNNITFVDGTTSTIGQIPISSEIFYANYLLVNIEGYSTSSLDTLPSQSFNTSTDIPAPWTAFYLESGNGTSVSSILDGDILAGAAIIPSTVQSRGGSGFGNVVILNLDLSAYDEIVLPQVGDTFVLVRPVTKQALEFKTGENTDILLNPQGSGSVLTNKSFIPTVSNQIDLGLPTRRWREVWMGSGSIYIQDETLGIDHRITARDGDVTIEGGAGISVGQFTLHDNYIKLKDPTRDIILGTEQSTGKFILNKIVEMNPSISSPFPSFEVNRFGLVKINPPVGINPTDSALSIIGSSTGNQRPRNFTGTLLQLTNFDGNPGRISIDTFGTGSYGLIAARTARGTVDTPLQTKANDTLLRLTAQGWHDSNNYVGTIVRMNLEAGEDFTTTAAGTLVRFQTTPIGSTTIQTSAIIDTDGLILPNVPNNETAEKILVWDSVTGRVGKQSGVSAIDGGAAASVFIMTTEVLNGGNA